MLHLALFLDLLHLLYQETIICSFTNAKFSSYYSKIINSNSRDAIHVLDGLLNNDIDLNTGENYTNITRYTKQIFDLTYLLRFILLGTYIMLNYLL